MLPKFVNTYIAQCKSVIAYVVCNVAIAYVVVCNAALNTTIRL